MDPLTALVYLNFIFLNNVCYNLNGDVVRSSNVVCLKFGSTDEDLKKRSKQHLGEYCAYASKSLLSYYVSNGKKFEKNIKKILVKYRILVRCAPQADKTPYEFYLVNEKVINKIKNYMANYEHQDHIKLNFDYTNYYNDYNSLSDYVLDEYDSYNNLKVMTNTKNTLTAEQKRIFKNYGYEGALEKFKLIKEQQLEALKKSKLARKREDVFEESESPMKRVCFNTD